MHYDAGFINSTQEESNISTLGKTTSELGIAQSATSDYSKLIVTPKQNNICVIQEYNPVTKPEHYAGTRIEVIDYIEDKNLGFCLGNAVKYISRAGRKQSAAMDNKEKAIQDLEKAIWYLERRIKELQLGLCD